MQGTIGVSSRRVPSRRLDRAEQAAPRGSAAIVCPHCGERGSVTKKRATTKGTTSAGKVALGIVTLGASVPLVGGTRRNYVTPLSLQELQDNLVGEPLSQPPISGILYG